MWDRTNYYGASVAALYRLARRKRYRLVGWTQSNLIFVQKHLVWSGLQPWHVTVPRPGQTAGPAASAVDDLPMMLTLPQRTAALIGQTRAALPTAGPIVVGPWLGEVGFELLYWIPFLRWALAEAGIAADRVTVVSRGGCAPLVCRPRPDLRRTLRHDQPRRTPGLEPGTHGGPGGERPRLRVAPRADDREAIRGHAGRAGNSPPGRAGGGDPPASVRDVPPVPAGSGAGAAGISMPSVRGRCRCRAPPARRRSTCRMSR